MIIENLLILYVANLILDYPLQGTFLSEYKCKSNYILFVHCAIWALGLSVVLMPLELFAWWKVVMLLIGHYIIDYWKCRGLYKKWPTKLAAKFVKTDNDIGCEFYKKSIISDWASLYIDQLFHVVQVLLCLI